MPKIYTSYYSFVASHEYISNDNFMLCSVSRTVPEWFWRPLVKCPEFYPSWELLNGYKSGNISETEYEVEYLKNTQLYIATAKKLLDSTNKTIVFLCWEGPSKFCHRKLLKRIAPDMFEELTNDILDSLI